MTATAQALVSSAKGTPFTNSIEVGTEGVAAQTTGLRAVGPRSVADQYTILRAKWSAHLASHRHWGARLRTSTDELEKAVHEL